MKKPIETIQSNCNSAASTTKATCSADRAQNWKMREGSGRARWKLQWLMLTFLQIYLILAPITGSAQVTENINYEAVRISPLPQVQAGSSTSQPSETVSVASSGSIRRSDESEKHTEEAELAGGSSFDVEQVFVLEQKSDHNLTKIIAGSQQNVTDANSTSSTPLQQPAPSRTASVLRPSIEEVASELSKKHLNLEHENWRLKQSSTTSSAQQQQNSSHSTQRPLESSHSSSHGSADEPTVRAEQEIKLAPVTSTGDARRSSPPTEGSTDLEGKGASEETAQAGSSTGSLSTSSNSLKEQVEQGESFLRDKISSSQVGVENQHHLPHHQPLPTSYNGNGSLETPPTAGHTSPVNKQTATPGSHRRKKGNLVQQSFNDQTSELYQCRQFLLHHSSGSPTGNLPPSSSFASPALSSDSNSDSTYQQVAASMSLQLPCSCESRKHFFPDEQPGESIWLSCDNVQLMGSYFYNPTPQQNSKARDSPFSDAFTGKSGLLTRFSQRYSGLQTLHSQKFHYLQLFHIKSLDLSNNRLRQIKLDAFHGLEDKLEYINLANNLLGDARAMFDEAPSSKSNGNNNNNHNQLSGKLIFSTGELNRLKKLKWLSLHNNQISQLSPTIFIKTPSTQAQGSNSGGDTAATQLEYSSEILHLDLSENLLKSIPSESIKLLNKLETLKLSRNRITQLDQFSRFPKSLKYLDLSENLIRSVRQCNLIDLPHLIEINLSHNQLSHLDKNAFLSSTASHHSLLLHLNSLIHHQGGRQEESLQKSGGDISSSSNDHQAIAPRFESDGKQQASLLHDDELEETNLKSSIQRSNLNVDLLHKSQSSSKANHDDNQSSALGLGSERGGDKRTRRRKRQANLIIKGKGDQALQHERQPAHSTLDADDGKKLLLPVHDQEGTVHGISGAGEKRSRYKRNDDDHHVASKKQESGSSKNNIKDELEVEESFSSGSEVPPLKDDKGESSGVAVDDLDADESILSSFANQAVANSQQQALSDELNSIQQMNQFNSTLRLNLSHNLLDHIPGDSLLKFSNLQQLDLSFNRIRKLDSNYLCSIYNLVENLRHLDLSGNLLTTTYLSSSSQAQSENNRQLNKLFGCLQKLEKLMLSTNRLIANPSVEQQSQMNGKAWNMEPPGASDANQDAQTQSQPQPGSSATTTGELDGGDQLQAAASSEVNQFRESGSFSGQGDRLIIRFGDSFASKYLNTLDLSDNQLRSMPIIEQVSLNHSPAAAASLLSNMTFASNNSTDNIHMSNHYQSQLNQWLSSCIYLEVLNLNFNSLERLEEQEFEHLFNLRQLHLDFNKILHLPLNLMRRFTSLDRLSLEGNKISALHPLNELLERSVRTLRVLNLANNRLLEWPQINKQLIKSSTPESAPTNFNQQQQASIDLMQKSAFQHRNGFEQVTSNDRDDQQSLVFALEELNLEGNLLTSNNVTSLFDQLVYMKSLKKLDLSFNLLSKIKSEWFKFANKNLQKLRLTGNKINNIELGSFANNQVNELVQLNLDSNLLKELKRKTFDSLPRLRELNLAHNLIHTINSETFHQINSLKVLKLNNNKLTSWKCEYFSNLCNPITGNINADLNTLMLLDLNPDEQVVSSSISSLVELDLSHNSLSQLRANSISAHTKLTKLNLENNKLSFIPHDLFKATTSGSKTGKQIQLVSSLKYLNLAHNRIQTIDNINFRPLKNLLSLDLSFNELQTLGVDVVKIDTSKNSPHQEQNSRKIIVSNNKTSLLVDDELLGSDPIFGNSGRILQSTSSNWPALSKLRHLNVAHNQLTVVNQSLFSELSPFSLLNLNLSANYLESDALPQGFFTKITGKNVPHQQQQQQQSNEATSSTPATNKQQPATTYDLVFTLKLESLDLSYNRLNEYPASLLDTHFTSMESCDLAHNRIQSLVANSNLMIQIKALNLQFNPLNRESNELILFEQRNVRSLNLAATRLYAIQQATMAPEQLMQYGYSGTQLKYRIANQTSQLDLIRSISKPIDAPFLRHLDLSSNQLVWLAANVFDKMHSLQTLDLSNNQLTRLNLLNNQLLQVSSTLDHLNLASNLITNIDSNDLSQLSRLKYLDLSNMLSLQKMNCRFLSRLTSLKSLKMYNYPSLRLHMNTLMNTLNSRGANQPSERLQRKLKDELVMSTIGKHCFDEEQQTSNEPFSVGSSFGQNVDQSSGGAVKPPSSHLKWFKLEELELELFNNFDGAVEGRSGGGFKLQDELSQLLGPELRLLSLFGLNLTSIGDESLLGITNGELKLRISYTSLSQLPLRQLMSSLTKRTKLDLDFRNNNIQNIDMRSLQLLDDIQLVSHGPQTGATDHSSLKLSSNPIRCDCQTRPLWLWLNQRWSGAEHSQEDGVGQLAQGEAPAAAMSNANYWLKLNSISQTSDLKCYYPLKLRGKPTQHVYYNDLVCKGPTQTASSSGSAGLGRQSRKKNDTNGRFGVDSSYYLSNGNNESRDSESETEEDDLLEFSESRQTVENSVRLTKFNRYRQNHLANYSQFHHLHTAPTPFIQDTSKEGDLDEANRIGKRDQNSSVERLLRPDDILDGNYEISSSSNFNPESSQAQQININYVKHRPNTHQRHSPFNTLNAFNQLHLSKAASSKHSSLLTESDVLILSVISVAMMIMSFIIIAICLLKYKMDQSDKEQVLSLHNNLVKSRVFDGSSSSSCGGGRSQSTTQKKSSSSSTNASTSEAEQTSSVTTSKRPKINKLQQLNTSALIGSKQPSCSATGQVAVPLKIDKIGGNRMIKLLHKQNQRHLQHQQLINAAAVPKVLVPINHPGLVSSGPQVPTSQAAPNFLMRSPTLSRMHGLATNASDWFKYTLRAYPSQVGNQRARQGSDGRRRLFNRSQLTTAQLAANEQMLNPNGDPSKPVTSLLTGCPLHAFKCIQKFKSQQRAANSRNSTQLPATEDERCVYCARLLASVKQTKAQHLVRATQDESTTSSSDDNSPGSKVEKRRDKPANDGDEEVWKAAEDQNNVSDNLKDERREGRSIPPKLMKALVRQLDLEEKEQEERLDVLVAEEWRKHQQQQRNNVYLARERQVTAMKTFGGRSRTTNDLTAAQQDERRQEQLSPNEHSQSGRSQIPASFVDGRFAYQSESQLESPATFSNCNINNNNNSSSQLGSQADVRSEETPFSPTSTERDDIFILVHDCSPTQERNSSPQHSGVSRSQAHQTQHHQHQSQYHQQRRRSHAGSLNEGTGGRVELVRMCENLDDGSVATEQTQDECSHSSSPVAYGFMQSSPSATTLSSHNTTRLAQNRYAVNDTSYNGAVRRAHYDDAALRDNNNQQDYSVARKNTLALDLEAGADYEVGAGLSPGAVLVQSDSADEQIIVSRL